MRKYTLEQIESAEVLVDSIVDKVGMARALKIINRHSKKYKSLFLKVLKSKVFNRKEAQK